MSGPGLGRPDRGRAQRRRFLQRTLVFGAGLPVASTARSAPARFRGTTLRFQLPQHPHFERVVRQLPKFTTQTGIQVEASVTPYLGMRELQARSFEKAEGDFDLLTYLILWKTEYAQRGWLRSLEPLLADASLAQPGFALNAIIQTYLQAVGTVGGARGYLPGPGARLVGVPCGAETSVLVSRVDLLRRHDLKPPVFYDELLHACRVLNEREGIAGLASRGLQGHHLSHAWLLHLTPHGGAVFDDQWNCLLDRPQALRATQVLRDVAATGLPDMAKAGFAEMQAAFLEGRAAFYLDSSNLLGVLREPRHAALTRRLHFNMHPSGSRQSGQTGGFGIGVAGNATQPEAAFLLLQWLLSAPVDLDISMDGGVPALWSTLANSYFKASRPEQAIMPFALRAANPDWRPLIPEWEAISQDIVGRALPDLVFGRGDPVAGHARMTKDIQTLLDRTRRRPAPTSRAAVSPAPR
jgi:multiple sugar transport system substrate-binding protein